MLHRLNNWATVIGDSVEGIWEDWSSGATTSQDTSAPHSGSACLKVNIAQSWGELQLGSDFGPSSSNFTELTFYVKRAESTSSEATLKFSYGSVSGSKTLTSIPTTWTKYTIPNSDVLSSTQKIRTINFQSNVAGTFYFDDMKFTLSGDGLPSKCADNVDNDGTSAGASSLKASALLVASALALIALFK